MRTTEPDPVVGSTRSAAIDIAAAPAAVYAFVSSVEGLGGLGPECQEMVWVEPGAVFDGTNRVGDYEWTTRCHVVAAEEGRRFAWEVTRADAAPGTRYVRWTFELEPAGDGTRLTHHFEILHRSAALTGLTVEQCDGRFDYLAGAMEQTLAGVKRALEAA